MATRTITALFDSYDDASAAVRKVEAAGVPHADISIVANNQDERYSSHVGTGRDGTTSETAHDASNGAGAGASLGTVLGGGAGLLTGLGLLAIPGVGPVVAAGWLVATLTGAGVGAAAGGLIGSLTGAGLSEEHAHSYAEGVRRGGTLVTVRADDAHADRVYSILKEHGSVDMDQRARGWREEGWSGRHDETAPSMTNPAAVAGGSSAVGAAGSTTTGLNTGGMPFAASAPPTTQSVDAGLPGTTRERHVGIEDELPPARQPLGTERR
ncbi:hypothetical protein VQ02_22920 [Methylobacterium variabile]|uniref:General stress protein 17M-like domain-containing protein n=1 Tax=Methylobacterium variabile TaxID=298794 RepID=A0A0J6V1M3_9HYPH|nr:general stress protein [Methylobacterium variabile]KMO32706.1 hypothetical protein VQ02_22920 [Methylobacterium variabile]